MVEVIVKMCKISELADSLINRSIELQRTTGDPTHSVNFYKLCKLLYIGQGWMLKNHGVPLFREGQISARECGPYIEVLEPYFWQWGIDPITEQMGAIGPFPKSVEDTLDELMKELGQESWVVLSKATKSHEVVQKVYRAKHNDIISEEEIQAFFENHVGTLCDVIQRRNVQRRDKAKRYYRLAKI